VDRALTFPAARENTCRSLPRVDDRIPYVPPDAGYAGARRGSQAMVAPEYPSTPHGTPGPEQPYGSPPPYGQQPPPYGQQGYGGQPMPGVPAYAQYARPQGPIGQIRPTGMIVLLFFVTFGIWGFIYYFQTHEEMKRHTGDGVGGVIALVLSLFVGIVSPFLLSHEVGELYARRGRQPPVTALTALWFFPGILILVGPFIWFVQTNNALNDYWRSVGAQGSTLV
jgi:hypothetical protein